MRCWGRNRWRNRRDGRLPCDSPNPRQDGILLAQIQQMGRGVGGGEGGGYYGRVVRRTCRDGHSVQGERVADLGATVGRTEVTDDRAQLLKFLHLLASDQLGERASAALQANRLAEKLGGWEKLLGPGEIPAEVLQWAQYGRQRYQQDQQQAFGLSAVLGAQALNSANLWNQGAGFNNIYQGFQDPAPRNKTE